MDRVGEPTIEVRYQCDACRIKDRAIQVRARKPKEGIGEWMTGTVCLALYLDHHAISPHCKAQTLSWVKIRMMENRPIGEPIPQ